MNQRGDARSVPAIVVHGGAGGAGGEDRRAGCAAAAARGLAVLLAGGAALDAVQAAVRLLEDDPLFNAAVGAALTRDGTIELDASIMDGATLRVGAIGAVPNLRRPIDLARAVLDDGEHVLLVGDGAWWFADPLGFHPVSHAELETPRALALLDAERARRLAGTAPLPPQPSTVGACAIDAAGRLAAATSTGGMTFKRRGRVGDSALPGCGTWADSAGAASATGHGEAIIKATLTRVAVDRMRAGASAQDAAAGALVELAARVGAQAGLICVDGKGGVGAACTTAAMPFAHATSECPEPVTGQ